MGESKIGFGDKLFLYGQFLQDIYEFDSYSYNSLMGMMTVGGYYVDLKETDVLGASVPGFVVDFGIHTQLSASQTPFYKMELVEVTDRMSLTQPLPFGTKIWVPMSSQGGSQPPLE